MKKPEPGDYGATLEEIERFRSAQQQINSFIDSGPVMWLLIPSSFAIIFGAAYLTFTASGWWVFLLPFGPGLFGLGSILRWIAFRKTSVRQIRHFNIDLAAYQSDLAAHQLSVKRTQLDFWRSLSGRGFERELAALFRGNGYNVSLTPVSGDLGVDIELRKGDHFAVVQCKALKQPVGPSAVRELYGTLVAQHADEGILASVSGFTPGARQFASNKPIMLMGLQEIIALQSDLNPGGPDGGARR